MHIPFLDKFPVKAIILQKRAGGLMLRQDKARFMKRGNIAYYELKKGGTKFRPSSFDNMVPMQGGKSVIFLYEYQRDMLVPIDTEHLEALYERDKDGNVIYETATMKCREGHTFGHAEKVQVGKVKKKDIEVCPVCSSREIEQLPKEEQKKVPKVDRTINLKAIDEDMAYWGQMRRWEADNRHKDDSWWKANLPFIMHAMTWLLMIILAYIFMGSISEAGHSVSDALLQAAQAAAGKPPG